MNFDADTVLIFVGLLLNIAANIGGMVKMWMSFDRRLTIMETRLEYHMPKRKHDEREA